MYELIPLLAGCAAGIALRPVRSRRIAAISIVVVALVAGALAATLSGEFEISAGFLLWDVGQGVIAGFASLVLARRLTTARGDAP